MTLFGKHDLRKIREGERKRSFLTQTRFKTPPTSRSHFRPNISFFQTPSRFLDIYFSIKIYRQIQDDTKSTKFQPFYVQISPYFFKKNVLNILVDSLIFIFRLKFIGKSKMTQKVQNFNLYVQISPYYSKKKCS